MKQPHIQVDTLQAKAALLPGDPARTERVAALLDSPRELAYNREFRTIAGSFHGIEVVACSTGIGGSSASIAIEELHNVGITSMIRIGSCGAMQKGIGLGDLILACGAVRDDGASRAYVDIRYPAVADPSLLFACMQSAAKHGWKAVTGIVHSHESFYTDTNQEETEKWSRLGVLGADMETAALFTVGRIRGIQTMSILNNVVEFGKDTGESIGSYAQGAELTAEGERREILCALEALTGVSE